jgi:hypothetical protein
MVHGVIFQKRPDSDTEMTDELLAVQFEKDVGHHLDNFEFEVEMVFIGLEVIPEYLGYFAFMVGCLGQAITGQLGCLGAVTVDVHQQFVKFLQVHCISL